MATEKEFLNELLYMFREKVLDSSSIRLKIAKRLKHIDKKPNNFRRWEHLYGKYVQMDDRFETVHVWSEELAIKNAGRWEPLEVDEEVYMVNLQRQE